MSSPGVTILAPDSFCSENTSGIRSDSDSEVVPESDLSMETNRKPPTPETIVVKQKTKKTSPSEIRGKLNFDRKKKKSRNSAEIDDDDDFGEMIRRSIDGDSRNRRSSSSDDDSDFENFLAKMRPADKNEYRTPAEHSLSSFITSDDSIVSEDRSPGLYLRSLNEKNIKTEPALLNLGQKYENKQNSPDLDCNEFVSTDDDEICTWNPESDKENSPTDCLMTFEPKKKRRAPKIKGRMKTYSSASSAEESDQPIPISRTLSDTAISAEQTFLKSLSPDVPTWRRHHESEKFVGKSFKKNREGLVEKLFKIYNQHIFENKLPTDLPITWNSRMTKTAGQCVYRRNSTTNRTARIELSVKVCDSAERVRDTLIHEMCHAAVWIVNGESKGGHGSIWKAWANKAHNMYPELPVISRCHMYELRTKYTYKCSKCTQEIHRHSKSLDMEKKICGICHGKFELVVNGKRKQTTTQSATPRQPPKFALFVKENYGSVKKSGTLKSHKEVMNVLSDKFKSQVQI